MFYIMMIYYPEIYYGEMNEKQGRWGAPVAISVTHGMGLKYPVHARRAQYKQFYFGLLTRHEWLLLRTKKSNCQ